MEHLFNSEDFSDVLLTLDDGIRETTFPAHRLILSYWSPFFKRIFLSSHFQESQAVNCKYSITLGEIEFIDDAIDLIQWMYKLDYDMNFFVPFAKFRKSCKETSHYFHQF